MKKAADRTDLLLRLEKKKSDVLFLQKRERKRQFMPPASEAAGEEQQQQHPKNSPPLSLSSSFSSFNDSLCGQEKIESLPLPHKIHLREKIRRKREEGRLKTRVANSASRFFFFEGEFFGRHLRLAEKLEYLLPPVFLPTPSSKKLFCRSYSFYIL